MSSFCFPLAYAQEGKQNVSSLYSVIVAVKKKGRSILRFKEKAAPFIVFYFLRMRSFLGVKYLPMFAYVTAVCLFHIQQFVCLCKHNQVTFGSVIVNLNPLQFELTETETHHLKTWYFQISCIFWDPIEYTDLGIRYKLLWISIREVWSQGCGRVTVTHKEDVLKDLKGVSVQWVIIHFLPFATELREDRLFPDSGESLLYI